MLLWKYPVLLSRPSGIYLAHDLSQGYSLLPQDKHALETD